GRFQSPSPLASVLPSKSNAIAQTSLAWPRSVATSFIPIASQTCTAPYRPPAARNLPSGENATARSSAAFGRRVPLALRSGASHNCTVLSELAEASVSVSGENARALTHDLCPRSVAVGRPYSGSQSQMSPSTPPL